MRRVLTLLFAVVLAGLVASPAAALVPATTIDDVVVSLQTDPVYNDPKAQNALTAAQADELRSQISTGGSAIFIAVLPEAARSSNSTEDVVRYLQQNVGEPGTYAAIVGNQFRSTSQSAATNAFQTQQGNGVYAVLSQFVTNVETIDSGGTVTTPSGSQSTESGSALVPLLVLGGLAAGAGGLVLVGKRRRDKANAMSLAAVKSTVDEDITAFGESLDSVDSSAINTEENRADWMAALDQYDKAKRSSEAMKTPAEAATVTEALDEGRFRVACVQARLSGEPVPDRRPPCFFDARHGLSVKDVQYTPAGTAQPRDVPACAACSAVIEDGLDPDVRLVAASSGGRQPYWQAGPEYSGYASGYYRGNGMDLFSTVLVGTMLGNMMMGGMYGGGWGGADGGGSDFGGDFG
ncbi:MAG TPA: hypothetical protein PK635_16470, partial [Actinomycetota bacterium]|nr:hypothetical protein [Actinomycetota bacterium]